MLSTISGGKLGAGGFLSHPMFTSQSRTNCLSKFGGLVPISYPLLSQKRLESGVKISSISINSSSKNPNSNFVSAIIIPFWPAIFFP